jgi:hypothetical protein
MKRMSGFDLEGRLDREERDQRDDVGDGVGEEGHRAAEGLVEERSDRGADDIGGSESCFVLRRCFRQLRARHDTRERGDFGDIEEHEERAFHERGEVELRKRQRVEGDGEGDASHGDRTSRIAQDHHALAIPAVDQRAHRQAEDDVWNPAQGSGDARSRGRAGELEDQQRIDDGGGHGAQRGYELATPQQHVIAIAPERGIGKVRHPPHLTRNGVNDKS